MEDGNLFYKGADFQIYEKTEIDPIVWDDPQITTLSESLISATPVEKNYFYTKSFKGRSGYVIPNYFLHPDDSFDPSNKIKTELFNIIETYNNDTEGLKDFIRRLIGNNVLVKDELSLLKCNKGKCDGITIGSGLACNKCNKNLKVSCRRRLYYLPRVLKDIFHQPGKIIEGVMYHSLKSIGSDDVKIAMNRFFKGEEGSKERELDLVIKNKLNGKLIALHITISPKRESECEQFSTTLSHNIQTIFVTTGPDGSAEILKNINKANGDRGIIFWDIASDNNFFDKIKEEIKKHIL